MADLVIVTNDGPVRTIRMNRPEKKNALTMAMYEAMAEGIEDVGRNPKLRCLMIAGAPTVFCAGNDIGDFLNMTGPSGALGAPILRFLYALARCDLPLVAAVQGNAVGVGTTMLMHCDHVVASTEARFSTPFVSLGLVPEAASSLTLPARIGHARAFSMFVLGEAVDARKAVDWGIANASCPLAELRARARAAADAVAARPASAVRLTKSLMRDPAALSREGHSDARGQQKHYLRDRNCS